jgi:hypothetical protein
MLHASMSNPKLSFRLDILVQQIVFLCMFKKLQIVTTIFVMSARLSSVCLSRDGTAHEI